MKYRILADTAVSGPGTSVTLPNPLSVNSFAELLDRIINYLILIAAPIVTAMIIWAAFQILTAGGSEEQVTKGRKTITYAVIGYAIILVSKGFSLIIREIFGS